MIGVSQRAMAMSGSRLQTDIGRSLLDRYSRTMGRKLHMMSDSSASFSLYYQREQESELSVKILIITDLTIELLMVKRRTLTSAFSTLVRPL